MLTAEEQARVQAIAARQRVYEENVGNFSDRAIHKKTSIRREWQGDIDFLLQLVERLTQGQARDEANIGIPF